MRNRKFFNLKNRGFTLIEVVVVMGIFSMAALIAIPVTLRQVEETKIEKATSDISSLLFQYQMNAFSGRSNTPFGIAFGPNSYSIFQGNNFTEATIKETIPLSSEFWISNISLNNGNEIKFEKGNLNPSSYGTIHLTDGIVSRVVFINREGLIFTYEE